MKWRVYFVVGFLLTAAGAQTSLPAFLTVEPEKQPFWRSKEKVWRRVLDQREVVVAVKTQSTSIAGLKKELYMQGVGVVDRPLAPTYQAALRFEEYPKISSFIKSADYQADKQILKMHTSAFQYDAHLKMELRFLKPGAKRQEIRFRVIEGTFQGLTGVVGFEELTPQRTEVVLTAQMAFLQLPMPQFFVEFGLEVALRLMATKMRGYVERQNPAGSL